MQSLSRGANASAGYLRAVWSIAAAIVLTFFATQIYYAPKVTLVYKIGIIAVIAVVGIAGILALLTPEPEETAPSERLYTADEVAALVAAVQAGRLVAAAPQTCKFCQGAEPDATGVDGSHYHRSCFQAAYQTGKT